MSRLNDTFAKLKKENQKAFIAYITAGDPSLAITEKLLLELEKSGVDIIELGVPFSDPLADGVTIQKAMQRALAKGTALKDVIQLVAKNRKKIKVPLFFMLSYNLVFAYGLTKFFKEASRAGLDGVIVPDLPPEEAAGLQREAASYKMDPVFLVAPTSTDPRIKAIVQSSSGFVYLVSVAGVTGVRGDSGLGIRDQVARVKKFTSLPVAVGFGVSNPAQAKKMAQAADGVIVGSAIVDKIERHLKSKKLVAEVGKFVKSLTKAVKG